LGADQNISTSKLGSWKLEKSFSEVLIAGKKTYGYTLAGSDKTKVKSKGVSGLTYQQLRDILRGEEIILRQRGVTIGKDGSQKYLQRAISATAQLGLSNLKQRLGV
jgi:hypothetical protein